MRTYTPRGLLPVLSLWLAALLLAPGLAAAGKPYDYAVVGDPANVTLPAPPLPTLVLMGGGPDVDDAFKWMIRKSGGGNFVVIRSRGTDAYNPYVYAMGGVASVETITIASREAASDPFVIGRIQGAEALFIAGGDQSDYVKFWKGTPLETAIEALAGRNIPIGGTSAGLSAMSRFMFSALNGSITSSAALANPYDKAMTLERDFLALPDMGGLVADSHMDTRDRMGRLVAFMARIVKDGWAGGVHGVGVDVETALLVEGGNATRVGAGSAYFLRTVGLPEVCKPKTPLTYRNIGTQRLSGGASFDMRNWASYQGGTVDYNISAVNGVLTSSQPGGSVY
ncbi:cyanophycinase [Pseudoduganella namucuonensis]|uniref:Cyanophycinase n=1 Tax=Pseudoduganella namucuonensis TaxID=1035707 RepID=A0A1I7INU0_9BURK|nr:cyanophycinase [Pseudoduganella namucuonensis]SFU74593.1 cyanophycinase [Pseudoduganella namucuonensis]